MADVIEGISAIEFREATLRCVEGTNLSSAVKDHFLTDIEQTVLNFLRDHPVQSVTHRETHNALRRLWRYAHREKSDPARLLIWFKNLPAAARARADWRARIVVPRFFKGTKADEGFVAWANAAKPNEVRAALRVITADGAVGVPGRRRSPIVRSKAKLEPLILDTVRGRRSRSPRRRRIKVKTVDADGRLWALALFVHPRGGRVHAGGRAPHADQDWLVTMLAILFGHREIEEKARSRRKSQPTRRRHITHARSVSWPSRAGEHNNSN